MKINKALIRYFFEKNGVRGITVDDLLKLDRKITVMKRFALACFATLLLVTGQVYINIHPYQFDDAVIGVTRAMSGWSVLVLSIFIMWTMIRYVMMAHESYYRLMAVRKEIKTAKAQFVKFFGNKPLTFRDISWVKTLVETVIIEQMKIIIILTTSGKRVEETAARDRLSIMFDTAKLFCPVSEYWKLFGEAAAQTGHSVLK